MKKILNIVIALILFNHTILNGQNLFIIGENSYPCSEIMTFKSNSDKSNDLNVLFAKDRNTVLFAVATENDLNVIFSNKINIYLKDGTVIKCNNKKTDDYVDNQAKAAYILTNDQVNKLKNSDIHTVRYTLQTIPEDNMNFIEWNWSASNPGIPTKVIFTEFIEKKAQKSGKNSLPDHAPKSASKVNSLANTNYNLSGRKAIYLPNPVYNNLSEGMVVVEITVDKNVM